MIYINMVPEIFASEDTVYHYCKLYTALKHILSDKKLRLSARKNSRDPIENIEPWFSVGGQFRNTEEQDRTDDEHDFIKQLQSKIRGYLKSTSRHIFV